jgi:hypothetical protein
VTLEAPACQHWTPSGYCHAAGGVRHYLTGHRCPAHTPAAEHGRPEPVEGYPDPFPGAQAYVFRRTDTQLIDDRAIASGRRRSTVHAYAAARAAEEIRKTAR